MANEDDDKDDDGEVKGLDEPPLANGVESVSWLPTVNGAKAGDDVEDVAEGSDILPLFPLGGIVYTPNTNHVLNIFEPRYRQMYNDILMNGSKRFVVSMSHPETPGSFAQMGVLFQLEDLKEVSEMTDDAVKYICDHKVVGRVKIHGILNPEVWASRDTYLKVHGTVIDEMGDAEADSSERTVRPGGGDPYQSLLANIGSTKKGSAPREENALKQSFADLVDLQHSLEEDVRFTRASVSTLSVAPGSGEDALWATIRLWQSYTEQRLVARQNELQKEFQEKLLKYLTKEKGVKEEELPSAIGFTDLSPALQEEVKELQKRMAIELQPLVLESTLTMQKLLEAEDHKERVNLLRFFVDEDRKRLGAKKLLQGMFTAGGDNLDEDMSDFKKDTKASEEKKEEEKKSEGGEGGIMFSDDEDAFQ